jgi:hypothetical protein
MLSISASWKPALGIGLFAMLVSSPLSAQDRDRVGDRDWDANRGIFTRLEPGTVVPIRTNQAIDVERRSNRVYYGTVDQDVRGDNGRLAIPRGTMAEMIVRVARDNDLILDLESVVVNGQRYAIKTDPNRVESQTNIVGAIVGAINGGVVRGQAVRIPRDSLVTFRLDRPLDIGIADRGVMRDGYHYHDWYDRDRDRDNDRR